MCRVRKEVVLLEYLFTKLEFGKIFTPITLYIDNKNPIMLSIHFKFNY